MIPSTTPTEEFACRVQAIPRLGLGLSVDCYVPDLFELMDELSSHGPTPSYLEIFKATSKTLERVQGHFSDMPLTYHGEGLWVTQPGFSDSPCLEEDLAETIRQLQTIQSPWLNHECAAKQMAGYSVGTYLPPLYTTTSARVVAGNITFVQGVLDRASEVTSHIPPLFLLEMAPLTYFSAGTIGIPEFFRIVTDRAACGLVLDIGHLWTVYRYTPVRWTHSLEQFVGQFLDEFPLERVVEIHVAGLAEHEAVLTDNDENREIHPAWIDAHAAPIPPVLWNMLEQVLVHPRLINLRAIALEVDTKPVAMIIEEFQEVSRRFGNLIHGKVFENTVPTRCHPVVAPAWHDSSGLTELDREELLDAYELYAKTIFGRMEPTGPDWRAVVEDPIGLERYRGKYLPNEILHWGGDVPQMFPDTCRALAQKGVAVNDFVSWWSQAGRPVRHPYDFFLLKIARFLEFVCELAPAVCSIAEQEATMLRRGYADANDSGQPEAVVR